MIFSGEVSRPFHHTRLLRCLARPYWNSEIWIRHCSEDRVSNVVFLRQWRKVELQSEGLQDKTGGVVGRGQNSVPTLPWEHQHDGWSQGSTTWSVWSQLRAAIRRRAYYRPHHWRCTDIWCWQTRWWSCYDQKDGHPYCWTWRHQQGWHLDFCRAMLCISAVYAVMRCLSVRLSVCL